MTTDTHTTDPVALEDLFAQALDAIRADRQHDADTVIARITAACGTTPEAERDRFIAAAADPAVAEELLDDLNTMGLLASMPAPTRVREFNFAIPEQIVEDDPLAHTVSPGPSDLRGLFG